MPRMKANTSIFTVGALITALSAGCASSSDIMPDSRTGQGAVAGAATGAVIGGIIGNNRGSGNTASGAAIGAAVGGLAGAAIGNQADRRSENDRTVYTTQDVSGGYVVQAPPPAPASQPYEQIPPRPAGNAVWIPGHYAYNGSGYDWVSGRWEYPPAGATSWVPPTWQPQGTGYVYVRGHWQ